MHHLLIIYINSVIQQPFNHTRTSNSTSHYTNPTLWPTTPTLVNVNSPHSPFHLCPLSFISLAFTIIFHNCLSNNAYILDWLWIVLYPTFPVANGVALSWCLAGSALQAAKWLQDVCMFSKNGRSPNHALKIIILPILFCFRDLFEYENLYLG